MSAARLAGTRSGRHLSGIVAAGSRQAAPTASLRRPWLVMDCELNRVARTLLWTGISEGCDLDSHLTSSDPRLGRRACISDGADQGFKRRGTAPPFPRHPGRPDGPGLPRDPRQGVAGRHAGRRGPRPTVLIRFAGARGPAPDALATRTRCADSCASRQTRVAATRVRGAATAPRCPSPGQGRRPR